jgi:hypothetical protein
MTILCTARVAATNNLHRKVGEHVELLLIDHAPKFRESLVLGVERSHLIFGGYGSAESRFRQRRAEVVIFPKRSTDAIGKQNPTYPKDHQDNGNRDSGCRLTAVGRPSLWDDGPHSRTEHVALTGRSTFEPCSSKKGGISSSVLDSYLQAASQQMKCHPTNSHVFNSPPARSLI